MLDDLREQASESPYYDEEEFEDLDDSQQGPSQFLGMTPVQRFIIALMLLFVTCLLSAFCLLVTERVVLPFF